MKQFKRVRNYLFITMIVSFIVFLNGFSTVFAESENSPFIKVGIFYGSTSPKSWEVFFEEGIAIGKLSDEQFDEIDTFSDINRVRIELQGGGIYLTGTNDRGEFVELNTNGNIDTIFPLDNSENSSFIIKDRPYRGGISFNNLQNSLNIINVVPVEYYLYGVLNGELGYQNPIEALKSQAVAARSFALSKKHQHRQFGFDICNKSHCQLYKGKRDEHKETNQAVDETKGEVLIYDNRVVPGYFFKNSGGHTQNVGDVWGGKYLYLSAKNDPFSPNYFWNKTYSFKDIEERLDNRDKSVGSIEKISIIGRLESGAVSEIEILGTDGEVILKNQEIRKVMGYSNIKSMMFAFSNSQKDYNHSKSQDKPKVKEEKRKEIAENVVGLIDFDEEYKEIDIDELMFLTTVNNNSVGLNLEGCYLLGRDKMVRIEYREENDEIEETEDVEIVDSDMKNLFEKEVNSVDSQEGEVTFYGRGYGHGIGMPQDSVVVMAKEGYDYMDILKYYYKDIEVRRIDEN